MDSKMCAIIARMKIYRDDLEIRRAKVKDKMDALESKVQSRGRCFTDSEEQKYDALQDEYCDYDDKIITLQVAIDDFEATFA